MPPLRELDTAPVTDTWSVLLPFRRIPLSGNDRGHTVAKHADQQKVKMLTRATIRRVGIPPLKAVILELIYYPGRNSGPDPDNITATMKYVIDGIVAAGVIPDDDPARVLKTSQAVVLRRLDPYDQGTPRMVIKIQDASALAPFEHVAPEELL